MLPEVIGMSSTKAVIRRTAQQFGMSTADCRAEMQLALDEAWAAAWQPGNIRAQAEWQRLFPGGQKPTLEEFIDGVAAALRERD